MLKKGDKVRFWDNIIGIVLNDGIPGKEFVEQYNDQTLHFYSPIDGVELCVVRRNDAYSTIFEPGKEIVWYQVLLGDDKIWIADTQVDRPMIKKI